MATDNPATITENGSFTEITYFYDGLDNGDDGTHLTLKASATIDFQVVGTFGSGGSVSIEGSNVPAPGATDGNYFVCTDVHGNAATYTSAAGDAITETPKHVRPHVTAGDGTTDLDVYIVVRYPTDVRQ